MSNLYLQIASFFCMLLVIIVYFSKKRVTTIETKVFSLLIIVNFIGILLDMGLVYFEYLYPKHLLIYIITKLYNIDIIIWLALLTYYFLNMSLDHKKNFKKYMKLIKKALIISTIIFSIIISILSVSIFDENHVMYPYGPSVDFLYFGCSIYTVTILVSVLINIKNIINKKYMPVVALLTMIVIVIVSAFFIRLINPGLLLTTSIITYINLTMYFTIENPDSKVTEELNILKLEAEQANNAKNEWLKQMRHELNTPAMLVQAYNDFNYDIAKNTNNKELLENSRYIEIGIKDIQTMVSNAVSIVELENKAFNLEEKVYKTDNLFEKITNLVKNNYLIDKKNIKFKLNISENYPKVLIGDFDNLLRIILNLLSNSFKYTTKGKIELTVNFKAKEDICNIEIISKDTGIGIKEEDMKTLFSKFGRIDFEHNQSDKRGIGLGLSIVKQLVELMDGNIKAESVFNHGSTFTIKIKQKMFKGVEDERL